MRALIEDNEEYADVQVIGIDMDLHGDSDITRDMKVKHHSTMVMFREGRNWRIIFRFAEGDVLDVNVMDYH